MTRLSADLEDRYPRKGDRLLRKSNNWNEAVTFLDHAVSRHAQIWSGYMRAGDALIDGCEHSALERNELIYPILFCYRHALEMAMKWIVRRYGSFASVPPPKLDHDLWQLWQACKAIFEFSGEDADGTNEVVEKVIKEFHDLDSQGFSFRYSVNKKGALIRLPDGLIDLLNVRDVMRRVAGFFDGTDAWLDELASYTF
jgi:hypothetical protein